MLPAAGRLVLLAELRLAGDFATAVDEWLHSQVLSSESTCLSWLSRNQRTKLLDVLRMLIDACSLYAGGSIASELIFGLERASPDGKSLKGQTIAVLRAWVVELLDKHLADLMEKLKLSLTTKQMIMRARSVINVVLKVMFLSGMHASPDVRFLLSRQTIKLREASSIAQGTFIGYLRALLAPSAAVLLYYALDTFGPTTMSLGKPGRKYRVNEQAVIPPVPLAGKPPQQGHCARCYQAFSDDCRPVAFSTGWAYCADCAKQQSTTETMTSRIVHLT